MTRRIRSSSPGVDIAELIARVANIERERLSVHPSGSSVPSSLDGPKFRDLADVSSYPLSGQGPVYDRAVGQWVHRAIQNPPFAQFGAVVVTAESDCPPLKFRYATTIVEFDIPLNVAGTSTTTIVCYRNHASLGAPGTVNIVSGATNGTTGAISIAFAAGDLLTVACSAAGAGAKGWALYPRAA